MMIIAEQEKLRSRLRPATAHGSYVFPWQGSLPLFPCSPFPSESPEVVAVYSSHDHVPTLFYVSMRLPLSPAEGNRRKSKEIEVNHDMTPNTDALVVTWTP